MAPEQQQPQPKTYLWLVFNDCMCENPDCYGKTDIAVYASEQTARQEAELRSKQYGGWSDMPDTHLDRVAVSTKVRGY